MGTDTEVAVDPACKSLPRFRERENLGHTPTQALEGSQLQ